MEGDGDWKPDLIEYRQKNLARVDSELDDDSRELGRSNRNAYRIHTRVRETQDKSGRWTVTDSSYQIHMSMEIVREFSKTWQCLEEDGIHNRLPQGESALDSEGLRNEKS